MNTKRILQRSVVCIGIAAGIAGLVCFSAAPAEGAATASSGGVAVAASGGNDANHQFTADSAARPGDDEKAIVEMVSAFYGAYLNCRERFFAENEETTNLNAHLPENSGGPACFDSLKSESVPAERERAPTLAEYLYSRPEIDAGFARRIEREITEARQDPDGMGGLEYDPVIMAQDIPYEMDFDLPVISGSNAEMVVYTLWGGEPATRVPICLHLRKKADLWKITDIIDMQRGEENRLCGGRSLPEIGFKPD